MASPNRNQDQTEAPKLEDTKPVTSDEVQGNDEQRTEGEGGKTPTTEAVTNDDHKVESGKKSDAVIRSKNGTFTRVPSKG